MKSFHRRPRKFISNLGTGRCTSEITAALGTWVFTSLSNSSMASCGVWDGDDSDGRQAVDDQDVNIHMKGVERAARGAAHFLLVDAQQFVEPKVG